MPASAAGDMTAASLRLSAAKPQERGNAPAASAFFAALETGNAITRTPPPTFCESSRRPRRAAGL